MEPKIDFWEVFFKVFFERDFGIDFRSFFSCFSKSRPSNFMRPRSVLLTFTKKRRFRKSNEKTSILESFSEAKTKKKSEKMVLKNMCFFNFDFSAFFCDFL